MDEATTDDRRPDASETVEPGDLPDMLRAALREADYSVVADTLKVTDHAIGGGGKTIVSGTGRYRPAKSYEPPIHGKVRTFDFEVIAGTHKDKIVVLDPVEVNVYDITVTDE